MRTPKGSLSSWSFATVPAISDRSTGSRRSRPLSLLARVRRASISVSCSRLEARSSWPADRQTSEVDGSPSATCTSGAFSGERGSKLVGGVGDEASLRFEGGFEAGEEIVEGIAELLELVLWAVEGEALVQAGRGDPAAACGDGADGPQHPAGDEPAGEEGERGHDRESDSRVDKQLVRVGRALGCLGRSRLSYLALGARQLTHSGYQSVLVAVQLMLVPFQLGSDGEQSCDARAGRKALQPLLILRQLLLGGLQPGKSLWQAEVEPVGAGEPWACAGSAADVRRWAWSRVRRARRCSRPRRRRRRGRGRRRGRSAGSRAVRRAAAGGDVPAATAIMPPIR